MGKTFDRVTVSAFGEVQKTYGNNNNQIKIEENAKAVLNGMVKASVRPGIIDTVCTKAASMVPNLGWCRNNIDINENLKELRDTVDSRASGIAKAYVSGLPDDFNVDTKNVWDYVAGLKTFYEINNNWSMGGGIAWRHRGANSVEKVNISSTSKVPNVPTVDAITKGIGENFKGSMEDGVEEFTLSLQGSRQFTKNLQLTLFGEYTFDTAEDKAQLGSDIRVEHGLRLNWQF